VENGAGLLRPLTVEILYSPHQTKRTMSAHENEGHFPEEAEENEIGGPVTLTLMILGMVVLIIWASC
jgi:hypothetical protein